MFGNLIQKGIYILYIYFDTKEHEKNVILFGL